MLGETVQHIPRVDLPKRQPFSLKPCPSTQNMRTGIMVVRSDEGSIYSGYHGMYYSRSEDHSKFAPNPSRYMRVSISMSRSRIEALTHFSKDCVRKVRYSVAFPHKVQLLYSSEMQPEVTFADHHLCQPFMGSPTSGQDNIMDKTS